MEARKVLILPKPVFLALRASASNRVRDWRLRALIRELGAVDLSPDAVLAIVTRMRGAWGNHGFTADMGFLEELLRRALVTTGPFLDCGSGLSTVILGALAKRAGSDVWSLEQDEEWYLLMHARLRMLGLTNVHLIHAPLEVKAGVAWYSLTGTMTPRDFPLVLCDGPAVRRSEWPEDVFRAWRVGIVAELHRRGVSFGTIVLDDAEDRRCSRLLEVWRNAGLEVSTAETPTGSHVVARAPQPEHPVEDAR